MNSWRVQGLRFAVVGITANLVLYFAYLSLTYVGLGHKLAMTLLYAMGVLQTFVFNKRWSFEFSGGTGRSLPRYVALYAVGYVLNLSVLHLFVDRLGYSHAMVQAVAIFAIAAFLFVGQKHWVFSPLRADALPREAR